MSAPKDWEFRQLGPPFKLARLSGWSAPFGRPRHEPVVTEALTVRQKTTYYPGTDAPPTRHVFGDKYEPWELKGRWMDSAGGKGYAKDQATFWRNFVSDKQPVAINWGDITGAEGFIDKIEIGRESEQHVAWKMSILIDTDTSRVPPDKQRLAAESPSKSLQALRAALSKIDKPLPTKPPVIKQSALDALDNLVGAFNSASAGVLNVVGQIESFEKAAIGDLRRLRGGLHQLRTAALALRNTVSSLSRSTEMFTSRSAAAELQFSTYFTKTDVDMTRALGAAAELDRQVAIAERGRVGTSHRAQRGTLHGLARKGPSAAGHERREVRRAARARRVDQNPTRMRPVGGDGTEGHDMHAKRQRGRGRPSKLTPELAARIVAQVRIGFPIELAAEFAGVRRRTVLEWVARGENREAGRPALDAYIDFAHRYRRARAQFAQLCLRPCLEAITGVRPSRRRAGPDGKPVLVRSPDAPLRALAARWHLARRFPEFWGHGRERAGVADALAEAAAATVKTPKITVVLAAEDADSALDDREPA